MAGPQTTDRTLAERLVERMPNGVLVTGDDGRIECLVDDAGKRLPEVLRYLAEQGVAVSEVEVAEPSLESVFLELAR